MKLLQVEFDFPGRLHQFHFQIESAHGLAHGSAHASIFCRRQNSNFPIRFRLANQCQWFQDMRQHQMEPRACNPGHKKTPNSKNKSFPFCGALRLRDACVRNDKTVNRHQIQTRKPMPVILGHAATLNGAAHEQSWTREQQEQVILFFEMRA